MRAIFWLAFGASLASAYKVDYAVYHDYDRFVSELQGLASRPENENLLRLTQQGISVEGEPLYVLSVTNFKRPWAISENYNTPDQFTASHHDHVSPFLPVDKPKVLLVWGEHARELVVLESFLHLVQNLTQGFHMPCSSPEGHFSRFVLNNLELHMVGLLNPDGKRRLESTRDFCWRNNGNGVDLNRNADWEFGGPGSSFQKGHEEYNGGKVWSEPESRMIRSLAFEHRYTAYVSLHSGEQQVFVPFVDSVSQRTKRRRATTDKELKLIERIVKESRGFFRNSGIAYEMNGYIADGALFDWMAGVMETPVVICAEMWGDSSQRIADCFEQFNPPPKALPEALDRMHSLYVTLFAALVEESTGQRFVPLPALPDLTALEQQQLTAAESEIKDNTLVRASRTRLQAPDDTALSALALKRARIAAVRKAMDTVDAACLLEERFERLGLAISEHKADLGS